MNYYKFHIGDFTLATTHLDRIERSIYFDLINLYYDTELPICSDTHKIAKRIRALEHEDLITGILEEFFQFDDGVWRHTRCDAELEETYSKSNSAKRSADARWAKRKRSDGNANAMRTHNERNANGMLPKTQDPLPTTHNPLKDTTGESKASTGGNGQVPIQQIINNWNIFAEKEGLPLVVKSTTTIKGQIRQRWKDMPSLENWDNFFEAIRINDFLAGRAPPGAGRSKPFRSTLLWITKETNFAKIAAGEYD